MSPPKQASFVSASSRLLWRACIGLAIYYTLAMAPVPWLVDGYRTFFRAGGNLVFQWFGSAGSVSFKPSETIDDTKDTTLVLVKHKPAVYKGRQIKPPIRGQMDITSINTGFHSTAFLIALVLATPIPWPRRLGALIVGLVLVNAFVVLRLGIRILDAFSDSNVLALYTFSPFWKGMLGIAKKVLVIAPFSWYAGPAFIWLIVCFRRGDLSGIVAGRERPAKHAPTE